MTPTLLRQAIELAQKGVRPRCGKALNQLLSDLGIRAQHQKPVYLTAIECNRLMAHLNISHDITLKKGSLPENGSRSDWAKVTGNEKIEGRRVKPALVRYRCLPGTRLAQGLYRLPPGVRAECEPEQLAAIVDSGVILVENAESFEFFDKMDFPIPRGVEDFIVVYRGDPELPQDACERFLNLIKLPVVPFFDLDPAGLGMARRVPGFYTILWPGPERIAAELQAGRGSPENYRKQLAQYGSILDAEEHPDISQAWSIIKAAGRGLQQELFFG